MDVANQVELQRQLPALRLKYRAMTGKRTLLDWTR